MKKEKTNIRSVPCVRFSNINTYCNKFRYLETNKVKGGNVMQDMEEIYVKYSNIVYKYVFCLTKNKEMAEEIVQDTFLVAVKDINKFEGKCKITTWLCQIAKNIWYQKLKKKNRETSIDEMQDIMSEISVEDEVSDRQDKLHMLKQIQTLDEEARNVMYLRILGNLEYSEIAEITGKTSSWARVVFFRAKQKLKEMEDKINE